MSRKIAMVPVSDACPIVVGVDGSPHAMGAVRWAGKEARSQDRALHVVHASVWSMVSHPAPPKVPDGHRQVMLNLARRWVREAGNAARAAAPGLQVVERVVVGEPAEVLIGESRHAREVVVAARGFDGPVAGLLGSTAWRVAQHAGCPVVVIRPSESDDPGALVVVGADGSAGSDAAVEFAMEYAARWAAPLLVLHAWSDVRLSEREGTVWRTCDWATVAAEADRLLAERLAGWRDKYPEVDVRRVVTRDWPVRQLLDAATGARLLVVGARGRSKLPGMLGSTSGSLLHVARCPLAIVRQ
jgi:nucleotide-binding universal stress UspA family protein